MGHLLETILVSAINALRKEREPRPDAGGLPLGRIVADGRVTSRWLTIPRTLLESHAFIGGVTGAGKTRLLMLLILEAIKRDIGLFPIIPHPDLLPFMLAAIANEEEKRRVDLSARCPIFTFTDRTWAVGMNVLETADPQDLFVLAAEIASAIRVLLDLESVGVRILELSRTTVYSLAATGNTLLEVRPFCTNARCRAEILRRIDNDEIKGYFTEHFDRLSAAEQATYSAALLNKFSELTADPRIAQVIGQKRSAVSLTDALDGQLWLPFVADKAVLREQGSTVSALFFIRLKNAIFSRRRGGLSLIILDEAHNLLAHDAGLEIALAEARKFHTGIIAATQSIEALPAGVRSALMGTGVQVFFRLSPPDADRVAGYLDGGKRLAERLKHLPQRHALVRVASERIQEIVVPEVNAPKADGAGLYRRSMQRWGRLRSEVAAELKKRHDELSRKTTGSLDSWE